MPIISTLPVTLTNGTTADATEVQSNFSHIVNQVNANAAELADVAQLAAANSFTAVQSGIAATSGSNFPIASQVQNAAFQTLSSVAGDNTITGRVSGMTLTGYARGQLFSFVPAQGNSGSATINIDGQGAVTLYKDGLNALGSGDLIAGKSALIRYFNTIDVAGTGFTLVNPGVGVPRPVPGDGFGMLLASDATRRAHWQTVANLPLASSMDSSNDFVMIRSLSLGGNARAIPSTLIRAGRTATVQVFTSTGANTYTKPAGLRWALVQVQAGGGGGGNASYSAGTGESYSGSGGGGGGYSRELLAADAIGPSETATVGAGGAAVSAGGTSSFGSLLSATGGGAGTTGTGNTGSNNFPTSGGAGGAGSGGDVNKTGQAGNPPAASSPTGAHARSGEGGNSTLGHGGSGVRLTSNGVAGVAYGGGGSGAARTADGGSNTGGAGADGIIIVTEYY